MATIKQLASFAVLNVNGGDRVTYTYDEIDGIDYQILVEADFLVNMFEQNEKEMTVRAVREKIFRTKSGKQLLDTMFLTPYTKP